MLGYTGMSITDHWSRFGGRCLHSSHAVASFVYFPAFCCCPGMKEIEQDAFVQADHALTVNRRNSDM